MFKNTFQSGFLSILYSIGSKPLQIWDKKVRNGHIKRITDNDIQSLVLEVEGTNVSTTYITCPADPKKTLGIKLPFLVMIIKNLKKYFTFEVQVLDDKNVRRRFRASNYQSTTRVKPFICTMPMRLDDGWNQIQFNLSDFTRRAYGTNYIETLRVQIHANCRIRRVYFSDRLYSEDELPAEFKLYLPVQNKAKVSANNVHASCHVGLQLRLGFSLMAPYSFYSALLLTKAHRAKVVHFYIGCQLECKHCLVCISKNEQDQSTISVAVLVANRHVSLQQ
uniref:CFA20 domain-containing protein n=1 Tax=Oncorhynchus tshawytscha TaxID=74940 RepID=A0A8C8CI49_ONCTS